VTTGSVVAEVNLDRHALARLEGTPLPQDAALDELRLKDLPAGSESRAGGRLDPLLHYTGRVDVRFVTGPGSVKLRQPKPPIDHAAQTVASSTGELKLDYGKGVLTIDAARAQGVSGLLQTVGRVETKDLSISSSLELGHIVVVSLDGQPLRSSGKMLLQVMSEEQPAGFQTEPAGEGVRRIVNIGTDPWLVKEFQGTVTFKRPDADRLKVTALDFNGYAGTVVGTAARISLRPQTIYYLLNR
jgi:hypothetical protein